MLTCNTSYNIDVQIGNYPKFLLLECVIFKVKLLQFKTMTQYKKVIKKWKQGVAQQKDELSQKTMMGMLLWKQKV